MKGDRFEESLAGALEVGMSEIRKQTEPFDIQIHIELIIFNLLSSICFHEK